MAQEDFQCPWDGKPRLAKEMMFPGNGSWILLANQLDLGRLGEKSNFQVSGLGNLVNVGPFAKIVTTGSGRRGLDWTCWVHSTQRTSHQGTSRKHRHQGAQWASIILKQSADRTGMVIKHWNECADLGEECMNEQEAVDSRSAPSLLRSLYCSMFHNLTFSEQKWGEGEQ